jgi:hypothetical protein
VKIDSDTASTRVCLICVLIIWIYLVNLARPLPVPVYYFNSTTQDGWYTNDSDTLELGDNHYYYYETDKELRCI